MAWAEMRGMGAGCTCGHLRCGQLRCAPVGTCGAANCAARLWAPAVRPIALRACGHLRCGRLRCAPVEIFGLPPMRDESAHGWGTLLRMDGVARASGPAGLVNRIGGTDD